MSDCACCPCPAEHPPCPCHDKRPPDPWTAEDEARVFPLGRHREGPCPVNGWRPAVALPVRKDRLTPGRLREIEASSEKAHSERHWPAEPVRDLAREIRAAWDERDYLKRREQDIIAACERVVAGSSKSVDTGWF